MSLKPSPDLILYNGRITTLDPAHPEASNVVIANGRIVGVDDSEEYERGPNTEAIEDTPNPPGGEIQRDGKGHPTGLLIARPNATILA